VYWDSVNVRVEPPLTFMAVIAEALARMTLEPPLAKSV